MGLPWSGMETKAVLEAQVKALKIEVKELDAIKTQASQLRQQLDAADGTIKEVSGGSPEL